MNRTKQAHLLPNWGYRNRHLFHLRRIDRGKVRRLLANALKVCAPRGR
jgi:hypothetical protein